MPHQVRHDFLGFDRCNGNDVRFQIPIAVIKRSRKQVPSKHWVKECLKYILSMKKNAPVNPEIQEVAKNDAGDFLLVDKPLDWTSFDVVAKIRNTYSKLGLRRKVGHCGTLDPRATGLLILATGRKTKQISGLETLDKVYEGAIKLGVMTESHDTETPEYGMSGVNHLDVGDIESVAAALEGRRMQKPPMHSAVWHKGKRLYELARKGEQVVERKAREICVNSFDILSVDLPFVHFRTDVSKGAYIRVLAHDFGQHLGVGGYLVSLRRVSIGEFSVSDAKSVADTVEVILRGVKDSAK